MFYLIKSMYNESYINMLNDASNRAKFLLTTVLSPIPKNSAVVFDIDDTLVDIHGNCLIPIVDLYNTIKSMNISIILITNRVNNDYVALKTEEMLHKCNITGYNCIYFRPSNRLDFYNYKKEARISCHVRGFNVIMSVGDQPWDMGDYGGIGIKLPSIY